MSNWPLSESETHISLSYGSLGAALYSPNSTDSKWSFVKNKPSFLVLKAHIFLFNR